MSAVVQWTENDVVVVGGVGEEKSEWYRRKDETHNNERICTFFLFFQNGFLVAKMFGMNVVFDKWNGNEEIIRQQ